ncbi:MaoC family dehydratase N-terminal domain-containing protein [Rhizobium leguminosarum]|uniref:FAS1-like dehydratase domain-containing protein n=1 Tax=Rhizobium leguminosarum TaxID=384 RepID=UPI001C974C50|nr:MaoC family dehydratase N-terminal domain-containing protein [Rhizobium leguminosarum]MBY5377272.1 protein dehydratase [Rhizobium leguminosarum]
MTTIGSVDVEHLRNWIGREETVADLVSVDLVQKFNATLDLSSAAPIWGEKAPPLIHYCLAQPSALTSALGEDGHPEKGGFLPPVPLPRRMWAGSTLTFHSDLHVGDLARRVSRISDVVVKEGRSGTLCFVSVLHKTDVAGVLKVEETQNIVYRDAAEPTNVGVQTTEKSAPVGDQRRLIKQSTPLLFRYSALTFNGHRIHYDRTYATEVEHYPGLVVHGPLQATLLLNFAIELAGSPPRLFSFRGVSPLFDGDQAYLHAVAGENNSMRLWTSRKDGPIAMSAEACW